MSLIKEKAKNPIVDPGLPVSKDPIKESPIDKNAPIGKQPTLTMEYRKWADKRGIPIERMMDAEAIKAYERETGLKALMGEDIKDPIKDPVKDPVKNPEIPVDPIKDPIKDPVVDPIDDEKPPPSQDWSFEAYRNSDMVNANMTPQQIFQGYENRLNNAVSSGQISQGVRDQLLSAQPLSAKIGSMPTIKDNYKQWAQAYNYDDTEQTRNQFSNLINDYTWMLEFGQHRTAQHSMEETAGVSSGYHHEKYSKEKAVPYFSDTYRHDPLIKHVTKAKSKSKSTASEVKSEEDARRFGFRK